MKGARIPWRLYAVALACAALWTHNGAAQSFEGGDPPAASNRPATPAGVAPAPLKAVTGFLGNLLGGDRSKPQLDDLKPGAYTPSNEAIGEARDLAEMQVSRGLVPLEAFTAYANGVLDRLKAASGQTGVPGQVYVVASGALDAGATADGNIYLSVAYLRSLKNEDQLAALLAHELAHVLLRHHDSNVFTRAQKQFSTYLTVGMGARNALEAIGNGSSAAKAVLTPNQLKVLGQLEVMIKLSDLALSPAWSRGQEREADRMGMDLLVRAGYSYEAGLLPWLEMVAQWDETQRTRAAEQTAQKQAALDTLFASGKLDQGLKQTLDLGAIQVVNVLSATHDDGRKRLDDLDAYLVKVYKENLPAAKPTVQPFEAVVSRPAVKAVTEGYARLFEVRDLLARNDTARATAQLTPLLARNSALADHALPNTLMYEALKAAGKRREAEPYLVRATRANPTWWEVYETLALYEKERGNRERTRQLGQAAFEKFSRAPSAYPRLVGLYRLSGLNDDMQRVVVECKLKQADMRERCDEAARAR
ncbi:MAG: M48 family metalloprotease [Hydrogenophaga sp.]|uniref:M48 family metalloprotease n=1 Tax=Hydrogenophaga sp. TaxID=1904254 RepID=UPI00257BFFEE|nr:M48 family metalloprotease [Hydrogenophaga sp.]MBL0943747.1 M48 family metalloprotease [Hydrogenophaga sp.]